MSTTPTERRGFALGLTIVAIVVIGTLVAGASFLSTQEYRVGRNALVEQRAFAAAEYGMAKTINDWDKVRNLSMANGSSWGPDTIDTGNNSVAIVRTTRLNEETFWLVSEGLASRTNSSLASRRVVSSALRVAWPSFTIKSALMVRGQVEVQGSSKVNGNDSIPDQWKTQGICPPLDTDLPAVAAPDTSKVCEGNLSGSGCNTNGDRLFGNPEKIEDPAAADTMTYFKYGSETWKSLTTNADIKLSGGTYKPEPVVSGGKCDKSSSLNWGDPWRTTACKDYFPVIYVNGSLKVASNAQGQGILLVNGDLELQGGFQFNGIVIVRDDIKTAGTGNKVSGAVFAGNTYVSDNSVVTGNAEIRYSSCAVERASLGASSLVRAPQRGWAQLF